HFSVYAPPQPTLIPYTTLFRSEKAVDSIISFKELLEERKDSIAQLSPEEQAKLKRLEPFDLRMVMNPEEKVMTFDLFSDFTNIRDRKSTRLNSSHVKISYAVFC